MPSRTLDDLCPQTRRKASAFVLEARNVGLQYKITSTYRSFVEQASLYAQGRTAPGRIVTRARPGSSFHNVRRAFDIAPLRPDGTLDWEWMDSVECVPIWTAFAAIGRRCGLEWGGNWVSIKDQPHFEDTWCADCNSRESSATHFNERGVCRLHLGEMP